MAYHNSDLEIKLDIIIDILNIIASSIMADYTTVLNDIKGLCLGLENNSRDIEQSLNLESGGGERESITAITKVLDNTIKSIYENTRTLQNTVESVESTINSWSQRPQKGFNLSELLQSDTTYNAYSNSFSSNIGGISKFARILAKYGSSLVCTYTFKVKVNFAGSSHLYVPAYSLCEGHQCQCVGVYFQNFSFTDSTSSLSISDDSGFEITMDDVDDISFINNTFLPYNPNSEYNIFGQKVQGNIIFKALAQLSLVMDQFN